MNRMLLHFAFLQPQAQPSDHFTSMFVFADDLIKNFTEFGEIGLAVGEHSLCSLRVTEDGAKRQIKFVRQRARKFAQRGHTREMGHFISLTRRLQLCLLSLANINDRRQYEQSLRSVNWVKTDFDRNLG